MGKYKKYIIPVIGVVLGGILYVGFSYLVEQQPITEFHRTVSAKAVYPGDEVVITSEVIRSKGDCSSTLRRIWTDSNGNIVYGDDVERPELPEGKELFYASLHIPTNISTGTLRLSTTIEFYCNPIQKVFQKGDTLELPDVFFQVLDQNMFPKKIS